MAKQVLSDALLFFDGSALADTVNSTAIEYGCDEVDQTTIDQTTRIYLGGLKSAGMSAEGFFQSTPDSALFTATGLSDKMVTVVPKATEGTASFSLKSMLGEYSPLGGSVGEMAGFSMTAAARGSLLRGTLEKWGTETATGNGTTRQLGAVTSAQSVSAVLHVVSASDSDTLDVIVESDDNSGMTSAITQLTFDQATAVGGQIKSATGPITDDYWRVSWTITGTAPSFKFAVSIIIQ